MSTDLPTLADDITLTETLAFAVPLYMAELVALPPSERGPRARGWASQGARVLGSAGDVLQFGGGRPGRAGLAFEALARGLAAGAVLTGEARCAGLVWTPPPRSCWAAEPERTRPARRPVEVVELPERAA